MKTFTVYLMNDEVNTIPYVKEILEKVCGLTTRGAATTIQLIEKDGKGLVFEARTEDEAWEVHTKLRKSGLTSEICTRVHGTAED